MSELILHRVSSIRLEADSVPLDNQETAYWQTLTFLDEEGGVVGRVVAFLDRPEAAIPLGDQPPYWGLDPAQPPAIVDGKSPF